MKRIIFTVLMVLFFSATSIAGDWCKWIDSKGEQCLSDSKGYILIEGRPIKTESTANDYGYYRLTVFTPDRLPNQILDTEVWSLVDNQMLRTWTVRDMTATEIAEREAEAMPLSEYYLWKVLVLKGVVTGAELSANLSVELKDAYLARKALLGD